MERKRGQYENYDMGDGHRWEWACDVWLVVFFLVVLGVTIPFIVIYAKDDVNPQPGSVGTAQLADGAVTAAKMAPDVLTRPHHWECLNASSEMQAAVDWAQNGVNVNSRGVVIHSVFTKHPRCRACDGTLMVYGDLDMWLSIGAGACTPQTRAQLVHDCVAVHTVSNIAHPHSFLNLKTMHIGINCSTYAARRRALLSYEGCSSPCMGWGF
jgi:hypothetical protein